MSSIWAESLTVRVPIAGNGSWLAGDLTVPANAKRLVVFVQAGEGIRVDTKNPYLATALSSRGMATLVAGLLSEDEAKREEAAHAIHFDIPALARRVVRWIDWTASYGPIAMLPLGFFAASTGTAAALDAANERPESVAAVVSRSGRPELCSNLRCVRAPTLLIVGGNDPAILQVNMQALRQLTCTKEIAVIPGAKHWFEEPGCAEGVAAVAGSWFQKHLTTLR